LLLPAPGARFVFIFSRGEPDLGVEILGRWSILILLKASFILQYMYFRKDSRFRIGVSHSGLEGRLPGRIPRCSYFRLG
jgi:hypothetical protein